MALIFSITACSGGGPEVDIQATIDAAVAGTEQAKTDMQSTIDASVEATLQAKTADELEAATNTPIVEPTQTPTPVSEATPTLIVPDARTPHYSREAEEYAVYSAIIQTRYIDTQKPALIVITEQTGLDYFSGELGEHLESIRQGLPDLTDEVCADFEAQNKQPQPLKSLFTISVKYVFISQQEIQTTFKKQDGWDIFYDKYPNAQGFMHLSGIGFNSQMDMALVYVGNMHYALAGEGYYVLLNKVNGQWIVQDQTMVWQS